MKKVKSIELGFENCEVISFDTNVLGEILIDDIHYKIRRYAINLIAKYCYADTVALEIFSEGNTEYNLFGLTEVQHKFDRILQTKDITSITVKYTDGSEEDYWVKYNENNQYSNMYQKNYLSDLGNLYIVIGKGKKIGDFYDKKIINDKEEVESAKSMFRIGEKNE